MRKANTEYSRILSLKTSVGVIIMAYKERTKSKLLKTYELLSSRMDLESDDYDYYLELQKEYEGAEQFDELTEKFDGHCLILNDLQLEMRWETFQIDALHIFSDRLVLYKIINYEGEHLWKELTLTKIGKGLLENPALELLETQVRLGLQLMDWGCHMKIEAFAVYINPEFTLFNSPSDEQLMLPSQIPDYFRELRAEDALTTEQMELATRLMEINNPDFPIRMPEYDFDQLRKGIPCTACGALLGTGSGRSQTCGNCGKSVNVKTAIKTSISDFRLLFPKEPVTSSRMVKWCGVGQSDRIFRILKETYTPKGNGRKRCYI